MEFKTMTPGLYQDLEKLQARQRKRREVAADSDAEPHVRHAGKVDAEILTTEILQTTSAILENEEFASQIQGQLNRLSVSAHKSRHRSLVITLLEQAQDRLRRELGNKPAN